MTMKMMDKYFEDKGFKVVRKYIPINRLYRFDITKGGFAKQYFWEYPSGEVNSEAQIDAMDTMIEDFYNTTGMQADFIISKYSDELAGDCSSVVMPEINRVIFNKPATIVLWADGTKTIVKAQGKSRYDKEKGLAMCIAKKALGNKGNYYNTFAKWLND